MPRHHVFKHDEISEVSRQRLQDSLILVHGGMAQNVGPILEMVTEKYLLRSEAEWQARQDAQQVLEEILTCLQQGDIAKIGEATTRNFTGPIQTIIPWATNFYTEMLIREVKEQFGKDFWGFWMLGGMSGGGMGFIFAPQRKTEAQDALQVAPNSAERSRRRSVTPLDRARPILSVRAGFGLPHQCCKAKVRKRVPGSRLAARALRLDLVQIIVALDPAE